MCFKSRIHSLKIQHITWHPEPSKRLASTGLCQVLNTGSVLVVLQPSDIGAVVSILQWRKLRLREISIFSEAAWWVTGRASIGAWSVHQISPLLKQVVHLDIFSGLRLVWCSGWWFHNSRKYACIRQSCRSVETLSGALNRLGGVRTLEK